MAGYNANFRNTGGTLSGLAYNAGRGGAGVLPPGPPFFPPILEIPCGGSVEADITIDCAKSFYRTEDVATNQLFFARIGNFRVDSPGDVVVMVAADEFEPFVTVTRDADPEHKWFGVDGVVRFTATDLLLGPFSVEVTTASPHEIGHFQIDVMCPSCFMPNWEGDITSESDDSILTSYFGHAYKSHTVSGSAEQYAALRVTIEPHAGFNKGGNLYIKGTVTNADAIDAEHSFVEDGSKEWEEHVPELISVFDSTGLGPNYQSVLIFTTGALAGNWYTISDNTAQQIIFDDLSTDVALIEDGDEFIILVSSHYPFAFDEDDALIVRAPIPLTDTYYFEVITFVTLPVHYATVSDCSPIINAAGTNTSDTYLMLGEHDLQTYSTTLNTYKQVDWSGVSYHKVWDPNPTPGFIPTNPPYPPDITDSYTHTGTWSIDVDGTVLSELQYGGVDMVIDTAKNITAYEPTGVFSNWYVDSATTRHGGTSSTSDHENGFLTTGGMDAQAAVLNGVFNDWVQSDLYTVDDAYEAGSVETSSPIDGILAGVTDIADISGTPTFYIITCIWGATIYGLSSLAPSRFTYDQVYHFGSTLTPTETRTPKEVLFTPTSKKHVITGLGFPTNSFTPGPLSGTEYTADTFAVSTV